MLKIFSDFFLNFIKALLNYVFWFTETRLSERSQSRTNWIKIRDDLSSSKLDSLIRFQFHYTLVDDLTILRYTQLMTGICDGQLNATHYNPP